MSVKAEWGMACPGCGDDSHLMLTVLASAMLSADGTEVYGDHEWTDESPCSCTACQWAGTVAEASGNAAPVKTALHYINAGDDENNFDLIVWAATPADAVAMWRANYETEDDSEPDRIWRMTGFQNEPARVLPWNSPEGADLVFPFDTAAVGPIDYQGIAFAKGWRLDDPTAPLAFVIPGDAEASAYAEAGDWCGLCLEMGYLSPETIAARIAQLETERDSYVLGHPNGHEEPNPEGWALDNPDDAEELESLYAARA